MKTYPEYIPKSDIAGSYESSVLAFWGTSTLFSTVAVLSDIPTKSVQGVPFCHIITNTLKKAMAPHSSTLAWKIPWTEEPGGLQSMQSLRVGHDWATSLSFFLSFLPSCLSVCLSIYLSIYLSIVPFGERNGNPLQCSCLENPRDSQAWWAAIYAVAQSWTRLKWLSSIIFIWKQTQHSKMYLLFYHRQRTKNCFFSCL